MMKKICLILTGGTFSMENKGEKNGFGPIDSVEELFKYFPDISSIADIEVKNLFNLDSVNIKPTHWISLSNLIQTESMNFDGFVIVHGTDTMTYTATALSFLLTGLNKPVILTGAIRPITDTFNDARNNLIYSVALATYDIPEVCIFFGSKLFRGNRCIKVSTKDYDAFESPNFKHLAEVGFNINIETDILFRMESPPINSNFEASVFFLRYFPGFDSQNIENFIFSKYDAIVVQSLGAGNLPYDDSTFLSWINMAFNLGKPFILTSQCIYGKVDLKQYQFQKRFLEAGAIPAMDMTIDTVLVKTMFLLNAYQRDINKFKNMFTTSLAGEITL
ncbi:MAG: asparaginase [Bacteroidetes bacterium]|nr:asparaginase [Bacteroidota bacterium]